MNTRNRFTKALALSATVAVMWMCVAVWRADRARAQGGEEQGIVIQGRTGLISLGPGQTARLNVLLGGPDTLPGGERRARRLTLAFDIYGSAPPEPDRPPTSPDDLNKLRFLRRESHVVVLMPGEGASFNFSAPEGETQISAVMLGGRQGIGNPDIMPTLEVMEGGRTAFTHPAFIKGFNPQPDPPGGQ